MDAGTLFEAISKVCPVLKVVVNVPDERDTWSFIPHPDATPDQKAAAEYILATRPVLVPGKASRVEFLARWRDDEYVKMERTRGIDIIAGNIGFAKLWDIVLSDAMLFMDKVRIKALKAALVKAGVLTQARADEIFQ